MIPGRLFRINPYMKKLQLITSIVAILSLACGLQAKEIKNKPGDAVQEEKSSYKGSLAVLGGVSMAGIQAEYTPDPAFGIRTVGLCIIGADFNDMNRHEYILSGILMPVLHLAPESRIFDPVLLFGMVYSFHHWEYRISNTGINRGITLRQGNLHDVTCGFGFGILFKFAERLKAGLNLWLNIDYSVETTTSLRKIKGNRILLPVPMAEFTVQF